MIDKIFVRITSFVPPVDRWLQQKHLVHHNELWWTRKDKLLQKIWYTLCKILFKRPLSSTIQANLFFQSSTMYYTRTINYDSLILCKKWKLNNVCNFERIPRSPHTCQAQLYLFGYPFFSRVTALHSCDDKHIITPLQKKMSKDQT